MQKHVKEIFMSHEKNNMTFNRSARADMRKEKRFIALRVCPGNVIVSWDGESFADYVPPAFSETIEGFALASGEAKTKRRYLSIMDDFSQWSHDTSVSIMESILSEYPGLEWIAIEGSLREPAEADDIDMTLAEELLDKFLFSLAESAVIIPLCKGIRFVMDMGYQRTLPCCPNCRREGILDFSVTGKVSCPHCGKEINGNMIMLDALYGIGREWMEKHPDPGCRIAVL